MHLLKSLLVVALLFGLVPTTAAQAQFRYPTIDEIKLKADNLANQLLRACSPECTQSEIKTHIEPYYHGRLDVGVEINPERCHTFGINDLRLGSPWAPVIESREGFSAATSYLACRHAEFYLQDVTSQVPPGAFVPISQMPIGNSLTLSEPLVISEKVSGFYMPSTKTPVVKSPWSILQLEGALHVDSAAPAGYVFVYAGMYRTNYGQLNQGVRVEMYPSSLEMWDGILSIVPQDKAFDEFCFILKQARGRYSISSAIVALGPMSVLPDCSTVN